MLSVNIVKRSNVCLSSANIELMTELGRKPFAQSFSSLGMSPKAALLIALQPRRGCLRFTLG